jgi:hypothetical protein
VENAIIDLIFVLEYFFLLETLVKEIRGLSNELQLLVGYLMSLIELG